MKLSESEKLKSYEDSLNNLPIVKRTAKVKAVYTDTNLARFLGDEAPAALVRRYVHRYTEIRLQDLSTFSRGRIYSALNNHAAALREWGKSLAAKEQVGKVHFALGQFYYDQGKVHEARQHLIQAIKKGETNAFLTLGNTYFQSEDLDRAQALFLCGAEYDLPGPILNLGVISTLRNDFDEALPYFDRSFKLGLRASYLWKADALLKMNKIAEAELAVKQAIAAGLHIESHNELARIYFFQGKHDEWLAELKIAALYDHDGLQVAVDALVKNKRIDEALALCEQCYKDDDGRVYKIYAALLRNLNKRKKALAVLKKAIEKGQSNLQKEYYSLSEIIASSDRLH